MTTKQITNIAVIAAIYAALSLALAPLSFAAIQIRIAEALVLLPLIYKPSIYGVIIGCFITNLVGVFMGANILGYMDVIIGTFATGLAAYLTYKFRNIKTFNIPLLAILMPVVLNGIIIGLELAFVSSSDTSLLLTNTLVFGMWVALGELAAVVVGYFLIKGLEKSKVFK